MKKILILFLGLFLIAGCSSNYEINFSDTINEKITFEVEGDLLKKVEENDYEGDGFYFEEEIINSNIPSLIEFKDYYKKDIKVIDNKTIINLEYSYTYDNFENSFLINDCFEKSIFINKEDYYYISLGGMFYCYDIDHFTLNLKTDYKVFIENSDDKKDGYYIWNIKSNNIEDKVEFRISKTEKNIENVKSSSISILKIIFFIILIIIFIGLIIFKKKIIK